MAPAFIANPEPRSLAADLRQSKRPASLPVRRADKTVVNGQIKSTRSRSEPSSAVSPMRYHFIWSKLAMLYRSMGNYPRRSIALFDKLL